MPIICQSKDTPPRRHDNCFDEGEPNRIVHVAFVKKGTTISLASETTFKTDLLAAEVAGNATIIRSVTGQKAAPSVKTAPGAGLQSTKTVGKEHSITAIDPQYVDNVAFWNGIESNGSLYDLYYWTTNKVWVPSTKGLSITVGDPITDDITTEIAATFTVTWSQKTNPLPYDSQAEDFVEGPTLAFTTIAAGATGTNEATFSGSTISLTGSFDDVSAQINFSPTATTYELDDDSTLPSGITLSSTGLLSGAITTSGTYKFTVLAYAANGFQGIQEITLIVT
jgi:hypothetical protein